MDEGSTDRIALAIDDDPNAIDLLRGKLPDAGYSVVGATNGEDGVQQARTLQPYAITLDILLPGRDGFDAIERLRQDKRCRDIPVIVLTAKSLTHEDTSRLRRLGVRIMQKHDLEIESLVEELRTALQRYGGCQPER